MRGKGKGGGGHYTRNVWQAGGHKKYEKDSSSNLISPLLSHKNEQSRNLTLNIKLEVHETLEFASGRTVTF